MILSVCTDGNDCEYVQDYTDVQKRRTLIKCKHFLKHGRMIVFPKRFQRPRQPKCEDLFQENPNIEAVNKFNAIFKN